MASGEKHAKAFGRCGWTIARAGAHIVLTKDGCPHALSIPNHAEVKRALLQKQIRLAGLSEAEYLAAFRQ